MTEYGIANQGCFITFEGPECAGKSTQIKMLRKYCREHGIKHIVTREPGGTDLGEQLRQIVKHHQGDAPVSDMTEVLLFAASRAQHVNEKIIPSLAAGYLVICDRFMDSTTAYQGYARGLNMDFINLLNTYAVGKCLPDLTFLLDISAEQSLERSSQREETLFVEDRIESEKIDFHQKVREGFLKIAAANPERIKIIKAFDEAGRIHQQIIAHLKNILKDK